MMQSSEEEIESEGAGSIRETFGVRQTKKNKLHKCYMWRAVESMQKDDMHVVMREGGINV